MRLLLVLITVLVTACGEGDSYSTAEAMGNTPSVSPRQGNNGGSGTGSPSYSAGGGGNPPTVGGTGGGTGAQPDNKILSAKSYAWDGTISPDSHLVWVCRETTTGQLLDKSYCANRPLGDVTWPTVGVPTDTGLWYRGVDIETICKDSIQRYIGTRTDYLKKYQTTISVPSLKGIVYIDDLQIPDEMYKTHWMQVNGVWSLLVQFDNQNWAVFLIKAPADEEFYDPYCRAMVRKDGFYLGYLAI